MEAGENMREREPQSAVGWEVGPENCGPGWMLGPDHSGKKSRGELASLSGTPAGSGISPPVVSHSTGYSGVTKHWVPGG